MKVATSMFPLSRAASHSLMFRSLLQRYIYIYQIIQK